MRVDEKGRTSGSAIDDYSRDDDDDDDVSEELVG